MPPSILPGSKKLGDERVFVNTEILQAEGPAGDAYRKRKLLEHYLEPVALKGDLKVADVRLLLCLCEKHEWDSRRELADFAGISRTNLTDFTEEELKNCINNAYDSKFDTEKIAPLVQADDAYYLELFHGSTIAFKDMALSILPHLMITSARKNNIKNEIVILTATSGDTGKAALAGFADVKGTRII